VVAGSNGHFIDEPGHAKQDLQLVVDDALVLVDPTPKAIRLARTIASVNARVSRDALAAISRLWKG